MKLVHVVAMSRNRVIGDKNRLLWHLPADIKRFKDLTMGHAVLLGRKTYDSLPERFRPLPGRTNIVLSGGSAGMAPGAMLVPSIQGALKLAVERKISELFVIGGSSIYLQTLGLTQEIYLTRVDVDMDGDAKYPELTPATWDETSLAVQPADGLHAYACTFSLLKRRQTVDPLRLL